MLKPLLLTLAIAITSLSAQAETAPDFSLDLHNASSLQQLSEHNYVYVDFWASWCGPCRYSFPFMNKLQAELGDDGLVVIAVNVDVDPKDAKPFLQQHPAEFAIHYDPSGDIATAFAVRGMPSSYLIHKGEILTKHVGFRKSKQDQMFAEIASYLKPQ
ncbi:TlpA disulfide reductase family protein [uncultured Ferrimonas sp.]|uniref:TlpA family protein disulfide reductase n=1 Tax=uncultured Ferrimonas sp. TaxID=432640 RepID=UPI00262C2872|nr:TlpA disulfide reductase family protein [uncultured Ferrimonas sp.]